VEFCLYVNDLELLADPDELFQGMAPDDLPAPLRNAVLNNPNAMEYVAHLHAVTRLAESGWDVEAVTRLYFGQEFCDQLIPTPEDVCNAYYIARQYGWAFSLVTCVVTDAGLAAWMDNVEALLHAADAAGGDDIEVVVNDWGVLRRLRRQYPTVRPVLGRMLVKQKRLGEFPQHMPAPCMEEIDTTMDELLRNQGSAWRNLNLTIDGWREHLRSQGITRIDLDMTPQGVDLDTAGWGFAFSTYYPWSYLTSGRSCPTAGLVDVVRRYKPVDKPCPRVCRHANANLANLAIDPAPILHRGRVVMVFNDVFAAPYLNGTVPVDRLVYEPYIPL